jgi:hypothetical protein
VHPTLRLCFGDKADRDQGKRADDKRHLHHFSPPLLEPDHPSGICNMHIIMRLKYVRHAHSDTTPCCHLPRRPLRMVL